MTFQWYFENIWFCIKYIAKNELVRIFIARYCILREGNRVMQWLKHPLAALVSGSLVTITSTGAGTSNSAGSNMLVAEVAVVVLWVVVDLVAVVGVVLVVVGVVVVVIGIVVVVSCVVSVVATLAFFTLRMACWMALACWMTLATKNTKMHTKASAHSHKIPFYYTIVWKTRQSMFVKHEPPLCAYFIEAT